MGGGSVRMPAALCGVVGLKPTFNRIPHSGVIPLNWTVGMVGILAGTVEDALITLLVVKFHPIQLLNLPLHLEMAQMIITYTIQHQVTSYKKGYFTSKSIGLMVNQL